MQCGLNIPAKSTIPSWNSSSRLAPHLENLQLVTYALTPAYTLQHMFWHDPGSNTCKSNLQDEVVVIVGPIGCRPNRGFHLLLHHHHHPAVSRLSINSHIQAISASPPTYHTSPKRGQRLGSSGDDKYDDKDTHKDKYDNKDRTFKKKVFLYNYVKVLCPAINIYRQTVP